MPVYNFTAMDGQGKEKKGRIEASNQQQAAAKLKEGGYMPTNLKEAAAEKSSVGGTTSARTQGSRKKGGGIALGTPVIKKKKLTNFTRQLATLLKSGLPLMRALRSLERQARKDVVVRQVVGDLADSVEGGMTFSEALAKHPKTFNKLYVNMVRAGEAAGEIENSLERLALFMEKAQKVSGQVKAAMIYPLIVFFIGGLIAAFLLYWAIPKFEGIFEDMLEGAPLPPLTRFVMAASDLLVQHGLIVLLFLIFLVILFFVIKSTKSGGYAIDWMKLKMPPFNQLVIRSASARLCRTLGTLMNSGVSVLQALQIVKETSGNEVVARATQSIHDSVKEGESMARPMEASNVFPVLVISMVEVGEETGSLPEMLNRISDVYEEEVDRAVESLTSLLEPIMIIMLAVIMGTIIVAMFLPLIEVFEKLGSTR